ncbi:MAG: hypothetical protein WKF82_12860 [Nocardioidaceae bacterium]
MLNDLNRVVEAVGILAIAVDVAREQGLTQQEATCQLNLGELLDPERPAQEPLRGSRRLWFFIVEWVTKVLGRCVCTTLPWLTSSPGAGKTPKISRWQAVDAAPDGIMKAVAHLAADGLIRGPGRRRESPAAVVQLRAVVRQ